MRRSAIRPSTLDGALPPPDRKKGHVTWGSLPSPASKHRQETHVLEVEDLAARVSIDDSDVDLFLESAQSVGVVVAEKAVVRVSEQTRVSPLEAMRGFRRRPHFHQSERPSSPREFPAFIIPSPSPETTAQKKVGTNMDLFGDGEPVISLDALKASDGAQFLGRGLHSMPLDTEDKESTSWSGNGEDRGDDTGAYEDLQTVGQDMGRGAARARVVRTADERVVSGTAGEGRGYSVPADTVEVGRTVGQEVPESTAQSPAFAFSSPHRVAFPSYLAGTVEASTEGGGRDPTEDASARRHSAQDGCGGGRRARSATPSRQTFIDDAIEQQAERRGAGNRASAQRAKKEWIVKAKQLSAKLHLLERDKAVHFYRTHRARDAARPGLRGALAEFEAHEREGVLHRAHEEEEIREQLNAVAERVESVKVHIGLAATSPAYVDRLEAVMKDAEDALHRLEVEQKEKCDALDRAEHVLTKEVEMLSSRFQVWELGGSSPVKAPARTNASAPVWNERNLPSAVTAFEEFVLETGGHEGGWEAPEHQAFLHVLSLFPMRSRDQFRRACLDRMAQEIPVHSPAEIEAHYVWYDKYVDMLAAKKAAIEEWRRKRQEVEREEELLKKVLPSSPKVAHDTRAAERRQRDKQQIYEWKARKAAEAAYQQEEEQRLRDMAALKEDQRRREQLQVKRELMLAKERLEEDKRALQMQQREQALAEQAVERKAAKAMRAAMLRRQERDLAMARQRHREMEERQHAAARVQDQMVGKARAGVKVTAPPDPERLLRPTEASKRRTAEGHSTGSASTDRTRYEATFPSGVRAVPSWRK